MKNAIGLFAALCLALVVALFVYFFQKNAAKSQKEKAEKVETISVLVASTNMNPGERVDRAKFEWTPWPVPSLQADYIRKDIPKDLKMLDGAVIRGLVLKGEPLKKSDLALVGSKSIITTFIKPGMRAESVPLNRVANPSVHYAPGDYVDVILPKRVRSEIDTETIIRGVRIIAVDDKFFTPEAKTEAKPPKSITLEVTALQAEALAEAIREGNVTISHYSAYSPPTAQDRAGPADVGAPKHEKDEESLNITILRGSKK